MFAKRNIDDEKDVVILVLIDFGLSVKIGERNEVSLLPAGADNYAPSMVRAGQEHSKKTDMLFVMNSAIVLMYGEVDSNFPSSEFEKKVCKKDNITESKRLTLIFLFFSLETFSLR